MTLRYRERREKQKTCQKEGKRAADSVPSDQTMDVDTLSETEDEAETDAHEVTTTEMPEPIPQQTAKHAGDSVPSDQAMDMDTFSDLEEQEETETPEVPTKQQTEPIPSPAQGSAAPSSSSYRDASESVADPTLETLRHSSQDCGSGSISLNQVDLNCSNDSA